MWSLNDYTIERESVDDMIQAGRFNPCLEITFRDKNGKHTHKLGTGSKDSLYVFREGLETYVLSKNRGMGYIGLERFKGSEKIGEMFIEDYEIKETLGSEELAPFTIIKRLRGFIQ